MTRRVGLLPLFILIASCEPSRNPTAAAPEAPSAPAQAVGVAPLLSLGPDALADRYLVVFKPGHSAAVNAASTVAAAGGRLHHTYSRVLNGFAATLPASAMTAIRRNPNVQLVAEDGIALPSTEQAGATWGLDRIDQRALPLSTTYGYTPTGAGVRAYVIDSGILTTHPDFGGRASEGWDAVDGIGGQLDCNGHGTHVAGTIGGNSYGVAKGVTLIGVRVFPCSGGASFTTIIAAVEWVTANAVHPAVVNMSLGGGYYAPLDIAIENSIASGIAYAVSAGNESQDACNVSPASTANALTVGASTMSDARASFSNWGPCVDLFAPGSSITSAGLGGGAATMSGTSMASPHVAGVAALYLQGNPGATAGQVNGAILQSTTVNKLTGLLPLSPNLLLYSPLTSPASSLSLNPSAISLTFAHVSAPASASGAASGVEFKAGGTGVPKAGMSAVPGTVYISSMSEVINARMHLTNAGGTALDWEAVGSQPWISAAPANGLISAGASAFTHAVVDSDGLPDGVHAGNLTFTDLAVPGSPHVVPITARVVTATALPFGAPTTVSGSAGSQTFFEVAVPEGVPHASVQISGGTGDADLYVAERRVPTLSDYDCRPYLSNNNESCAASYPPPGTLYVMLVGYGSYTNVTLSATMSGPPAAPTAFTGVHGTSMTQIELAWADNASNEVDFQLQRSAYSGSWSAFADLATRPAANATSLNDTPVASGTAYQYRIRACNTAGCSAWANTGSVAAPTRPTAPTTLVRSVLSATSIRLTWTDQSGNEMGFTLQRRSRTLAGSFGLYTHIAQLGPNVVSYDDPGLTTGHVYQYRVSAFNVAGYSGVETSNTLHLAPPTVPSGVTAVVLSGTSIRVSWTDASPNEASFEVERRVKNPDNSYTAWTSLAVHPANQTGHTDATVAIGVRYEYRVRARNAAGDSPFAQSGLVVFTKPTAPAALVGVPSGTTIDLTWSDNSSNEARFRLERRTKTGGVYSAYTHVANLVGNLEAYANTGLVAGTTYEYRIRAENPIGNSPYALSGLITIPAPE